MFALSTLKKTLEIHPSHYTTGVKAYVENLLRQNIEDSCTSSGYIVAILAILDYGDFKLQRGTCILTATFHALVLRPEKGEVADIVVRSTNDMGVFGYIGPVRIFVSKLLMPDDHDMKFYEGKTVRVRILGCKTDTNQCVAIGCLNEEGLGLIE